MADTSTPPDVQELRCGFCGDTTLWPAENSVYMMVYGIQHVLNDCPEATDEARADAMEADVIMRVEGRLPNVEDH